MRNLDLYRSTNTRCQKTFLRGCLFRIEFVELCRVPRFKNRRLVVYSERRFRSWEKDEFLCKTLYRRISCGWWRSKIGEFKVWGQLRSSKLVVNQCIWNILCRQARGKHLFTIHRESRNRSAPRGERLTATNKAEQCPVPEYHLWF